MLFFMLIDCVYSTILYKVYQMYDTSLDRIYIRIFVHNLFAHDLKIFYINQQKKSIEFLKTQGNILKKNFFKMKYDDEESNYLETSEYSIFYIVVNNKELKNNKMMIQIEHINYYPIHELKVKTCTNYTLISVIYYYYPHYIDQLSNWIKFLHDKIKHILMYFNKALNIAVNRKYVKRSIDFLDIYKLNVVYERYLKTYTNDLIKIESLKNIRCNKYSEKNLVLKNDDICLYKDCYNMILYLYKCYLLFRNHYLEIMEFFSHKEVTQQTNEDIYNDDMIFLDTLDKNIWPLNFIHKRIFEKKTDPGSDVKYDYKLEKNYKINDKNVKKQKLKKQIDEENDNDENRKFNNTFNIVYMFFFLLFIVVFCKVMIFLQKNFL